MGPKTGLEVVTFSSARLQGEKTTGPCSPSGSDLFSSWSRAHRKNRRHLVFYCPAAWARALLWGWHCRSATVAPGSGHLSLDCWDL